MRAQIKRKKENPDQIYTHPSHSYEIKAYFESLIELAQALCKINEFEEVIRLIISNAKTLFKAEEIYIIIMNPRTRQTLKPLLPPGKKEIRELKHILTMISGWVVKNKKPFLSNRLSKDNRFRKKMFENCTVKSCLCIPLLSEDLVFGTIILLDRNDGVSFSKFDLQLLEYFAAIVSPFLHKTHRLENYFKPFCSDKVLLKKFESLGLIGRNKKFISLLKSIEAAASCDVRVLLEGQSGTGKELIVKAIHRLSKRRDKKFIAIDCGAIPANLIESELFGHVKGAFTGANMVRKGLLEDAEGGTIFMDEINNLPMEMQVKLLRVLQEGEIRPLGANTTRKVDVRIISASSVCLKELVQKKKLREDLFYRLHVFPIRVPSLDERRGDIPMLAHHFMMCFSSKQNKNIQILHEEIIDFLKQRHWAGNIREMEHLIERLVTLCPQESTVIVPSLLPDEYKKEWKKLKETIPLDGGHPSLNDSVTQLEKDLILRALIKCNWNQSQAARAIRISEQTLRYKMTKFGIRKPLN